MKKKLLAVSAVLVVITAALCAFVACGNGGREELKGTITLVIGTETPAVYMVDLQNVQGKQGLISVLTYLNETEGVPFAAEYSVGNGAFLTKAGDLSQDVTAGVYLYLYTSVEADYDVSGYAQTVNYGGKTLTSSGVGANEMTLTDGCVIYIGTIVYSV